LTTPRSQDGALKPASAFLSAGFRYLGSCPRAAGWSAATLCFGTNPPCWGGLMTSVDRGRPEGAGPRSERRDCEGFRMTAHGDGSACTGAVVRKPPGKEPAGDDVPTVPRVLWRFDCGVDGGREAPERGRGVMAAAGGSWARLSANDDGGEVGAVESAAGQLSNRASPWPGCDQRETRLMMRVGDVATAFMRCRS
jgi:hypothetical protein